MTISAKIILDSVSEAGARITTLELYYPRFIHAEFMTHRAFSRNASSSRAIPVERMIESILEDTAMPIHWGANQPGMQARAECDNDVLLEVLIDRGQELIDDVEEDEDEYYASMFEASTAPFDRQEAWEYARDEAIKVARAFHAAGYHKQIVNRLLEPFSHIRVVVTATEWENFFALRLHPDAQPEIQELARCIKEAMDASKPRRLDHGAWHIPYLTAEEWYDDDLDISTCLAISVARCARVSYRLHDGKPTTVEKDLELFRQLIEATPAHASPCEHQARAAFDPTITSRNFKGWMQYREALNV